MKFKLDSLFSTPRLLNFESALTRDILRLTSIFILFFILLNLYLSSYSISLILLPFWMVNLVLLRFWKYFSNRIFLLIGYMFYLTLVVTQSIFFSYDLHFHLYFVNLALLPILYVGILKKRVISTLVLIPIFFYVAFDKLGHSLQVFRIEPFLFNERQILILSSIALITTMSIAFLLVYLFVLRAKEREQMLLEHRSQLHALINNTADYIWSIDKDWRYVIINNELKIKIKEYFGVDIVEGELLEIKKYPSSVNDKRIPAYQRAFAGEKVDFQYEFNTPKHGIRIIQTSFNPIFDFDNKVVGVAAFAHDITEKILTDKQIETQKALLVQSSKLSSLGEMAGGIAHEINNPLMIIMGTITQIKNSILRGDIEKEDALRKIERIEKTTSRINRIVKGLRSFSRNSENDPFQQSMFAPILDETLELCRERLKHQEIHFEVDIKNDCLFECRVTEIIQVLLNTLNNAIDAISGTSSPWIKISCDIVGPVIEITITDSGPGIPDSIKEKIFNPFFSTKDVGKGTGLGLSISKSIIENHHGQFFLDNQCANTRFVIQLPKS